VLGTSDLDASDLDASDLDASDLDASDLGDDEASLRAAIDRQQQARAAVGAPVVASTFVRERAIRAALAAHDVHTDKPGAPALAGARADVARRRSRRGPLPWLLPAIAAAAVVVLIAGFAGLLFRSASTTTSLTTGASQDAAAPVAGTAAASADQGSAGGSGGALADQGFVDFGTLNDQAQLVQSVDARTRFETYSAAVPQSATTSASGDASSANKAGSASGLLPCESQSRAVRPELATSTLVAAGYAQFQGQPSTVYVFLSSPPDGRSLVALTTATCQVVVDTTF
jgi:hypothetical protein